MPATATRPKLQPTMAVGQPFVMPMLGAGPPKPQLRVPEKAALVGANTGKVYAMLGDNPNGPETMSVTPPAPTTVTPGPQDIVLGRELAQLGGGRVSPETPASFAGGGTMTVGPDGTVASSYMDDGGSSGGGGAPNWDQQYYEKLRQQQRQQAAAAINSQYSVIGARQATLPYQANLIGARQAQLPYQQQAIQARMATLPSQYAVLGARQATFAPRTAVNNAGWAVLGAQNQSLAANRGLIGQEQSANAADLVDINAVRAARTNVADQNAVGQEALRRGVENQQYARLGVAAPVDVNTAPGAEGTVAPWARATLQTQEDIAKTQASDNANQRGNQLRAAQLAVQMQDTNVTEAENAARAAGLTLDQANQMVDQASNNAGYSQLGATAAGYQADQAGLDVSRASNDLAMSQLGVSNASDYADLASLDSRSTANDISNLQAPTDEGYELYTDPNTRQRMWLTPADADARGLLTQRQNRLNVDQAVIPQEYQYSQQRQQFQNQQQADGSPLAALSIPQLLNTVPTTGASEASQERVLSEIARRYIQQGYDPQQAQRAAEILLTQELQTRRGQSSSTIFGSSTGTAPTTPAAPAGGGNSGFKLNP